MASVPFMGHKAYAEGIATSSWREALQHAPWGFIIIVLVPTLISAVYMFLIAAPIYVSETQFVVRSQSQGGASAFGVMMGSFGLDLGASETDAYEIDGYMMSRDAVANLVIRNELRKIVGRSEADFLARFPRPFEADTFENLYRDYPRFVSVGYDSTTGINTLKVQAFRPSDAQIIAQALLADGEKLINQLNRRAMSDIVEQAQLQVAEAQGRAVRSEVALTEFRTREKLIDPTRSSAASSDIVTQLDSQLITLEAQRRSLAVLAPQSPELPGLDEKIRALQEQRTQENSLVAGESNSLAPKIGEYEQLSLDRDYATKSLANADAALEQARLDARKKQIYLERIVQPDLPDQAEFPHRFFTVIIVFISALVAYAIIMLVAAGVREHRQG